MTANSKNKAFIALGIISFFWGTTWLPSKLAVSEFGLPPLQACGLRQFMAGVLFLTFFLIKKYKLPSPKQLLRLLVLSIFFLVISNGLTVWALSYKDMGSGIASVVGATIPLWIALLSIFILRKQKITVQIALGLLLGFGGIVIIFADNLSAFTNPKYQTAILFLFIAALSWSAGTLMNVKKSSIDPFYALGWQMFLSGIVLFTWSQLQEKTLPLSEIKWQAWACIGYLIIIGSVITFVAYIYALKHLPAAQVAVYAYINPIIALVIGSIYRNEKLDWLIFSGALVTLIGVYIVNSNFGKREVISE